jgi:hypothetical protein
MEVVDSCTDKKKLVDATNKQREKVGYEIK